MLIVIVIIGILIASLMPRMQTAQGRARDVARKNDLSQIQTAIITSQADRWEWPKSTAETYNWAPVSDIKDQLLAAWMSEVPSDPNGSNTNFGLWNQLSTSANPWQYIYLVAKRNWVTNAWFVLMAKTEVERSSNWVVCTKDDGTPNFTSPLTEGNANVWNAALESWFIFTGHDLANVHLCSKVSSWSVCKSNVEECTYTKTWQLRYILLY